MTKTEIKKLKVKKCLQHLENNYGGFDIEAGGGSNFYLTLQVLGVDFPGQFSRRDFAVALNDSIRLGGDGWSQEQINLQRAAEVLEGKINDELEELMEEVDSDIYWFSINEAMGFRPEELV